MAHWFACSSLPQRASLDKTYGTGKSNSSPILYLYLSSWTHSQINLYSIFVDNYWIALSLSQTFNISSLFLTCRWWPCLFISLERVSKRGEKQQNKNFHNLLSPHTSTYLHVYTYPLTNLLLLWINCPMFLSKFNLQLQLYPTPSSLQQVYLSYTFFLSNGMLNIL